MLPPEPPSRPAREPDERTSVVRVVVTVLVVLVVFAAAGAVVGWLWHRIWNSPSGFAYDAMWVPDDGNAGYATIFSATAVFVLLGGGVALVLGIVASRLRAPELVVLAAVLLGSVLATGVSYQLGTSLGPPDADAIAARATGGVGDGQEVVEGTDPNDGTDDDVPADAADDAPLPAPDLERPTTAPVTPTDDDRDGDGLTDDQERTMTGTWPTKADTDGDGMSDADEDLDEDGLTNLQEISGSLNVDHDEEPTSPFTADSDENFTKIAGSLSISGRSPFVAWTAGGLAGLGLAYLFTVSVGDPVRRRPEDDPLFRPPTDDAVTGAGPLPPR